MKTAREKGVEVIINPAPAIPLPDEAYKGLGHLLVNETEAAILSGIENPTNWDEVSAVFVSRGVKNVVITLGGEVRSCSLRTMEIILTVPRACTTRQTRDMHSQSQAHLFPPERSKWSTQRPLATPSLERIRWLLRVGSRVRKVQNSTLMLRLPMQIGLLR